jgi:hypothetical protein
MIVVVYFSKEDIISCRELSGLRWGSEKRKAL